MSPAPLEQAPSKRAIGLIVPSSNRVVERVASQHFAGDPDIDCCFARVPYAGLVAGSGDGYRLQPFDDAAALLADAGVDVVCWNATRGAALGFEADRVLCRRIMQRTGIAAVTTALATLDLLLAMPGQRVGLITQGDEAESVHVAAQFQAQGAPIADHLWLGITDNLTAASVGGETLLSQSLRLAERSVLDAVLIWSTNLSGFSAGKLHADQGVTLLDATLIGIDATLAALRQGSDAAA